MSSVTVKHLMGFMHTVVYGMRCMCAVQREGVCPCALLKPAPAPPTCGHRTLLRFASPHLIPCADRKQHPQPVSAV